MSPNVLAEAVSLSAISSLIYVECGFSAVRRRAQQCECASTSSSRAHFLCDSFLQATLTSYSENVERTKYGGESSKEMGSGGNLKPWQSQKSSMDSCLYRVDENMTASTYSLNKIPERNLETVLSQSVQSIPLYLMPRPNSVAGKSVMALPSGWIVAQGAALSCHSPCPVLLSVVIIV